MSANTPQDQSKELDKLRADRDSLRAELESTKLELINWQECAKARYDEIVDLQCSLAGWIDSPDTDDDDA